SIGLYLFDKTLDNLSDTEKTYYSLINRTAISVAQKIIQDADKFTTDDQVNEEILVRMIKIYSFKDMDKERYRKWNGQPGDHPIVEDFRKIMVKTIKKNNLESQYLNFVPLFNVEFQEEIRQKPKFIEYQKQTAMKNLSKERGDYLNWIINELDEPHPIDKRKATEYYIQNRAIEIYLEEEKRLLPNKDPWNMSDTEVENYFKYQRKWTIDDFLSSREIIKYIAAPFGTGKTSFAKHIAIKISESYLSG